MRYGVRMEFPGVTQAQYDQMHAVAAAMAGEATGFVAHIAGPTDGGWYMIEVWQSKEDHQRFMQSLVAKMPAGGPQPRIEEFEVYSRQTKEQAVA
jgi:quinol monooxygenase YgiN